MAKPGLKEAIKDRTEQAIAKAGVRQVRVLEEIAAVAFLDPGELFDDEDALRKVKEMTPGVRRALLALEVEELFEGRGESRERTGRLHKIKLQPKIEALKLLGQYLKMFKEMHEHAGPNGGPIETKDVSELSDLDRARRVAFLLAQGLRATEAAPSGNPAGSPPAISNKQE